MKKIIVPVMLGFGVVLAVIIGQRMSTDAMAVVIGVAVGVAASVPTSLLLVALLRRQRVDDRHWQAPEYNPRQLHAPQMQQPMIIMTPPGYTAAPYIPPAPLQYGNDAGPRTLRVMGDGEDWQ